MGCETSQEKKVKFRLEKKMVVKVKYYEHLYFIRDQDGETLFAGADEGRAREVCTLLNAYHNKKKRVLRRFRKRVQKSPRRKND